MLPTTSMDSCNARYFVLLMFVARKVAIAGKILAIGQEIPLI